MILSNYIRNNYDEIYGVLIRILDTIIYNRPLPNREFDQIYMHAEDMLMQADLVHSYLKDKNTIFLGDGDCMSLLFGLLSKKYKIGIQGIDVFDFDERILNNIKELIQIYSINKFPINCKLYNIIEPVRENKKYDFFYINPPYGSKNNGYSCILWLHRCLDLCKEGAGGCIIIPTDSAVSWIKSGKKNIYSFLKKYGFEIEHIYEDIHTYHLDDNPNLHSSMIIVKRIHCIPSEYSGKQYTKDMVKFLYGSPRKIPKYIFSDKNNRFGFKDYSWEFGDDEFFRLK